MGWNWKQCRPCPSLDCSVRPFAGANCPHRTPLNCVVFDCGDAAWKIGLVQIMAPFFDLGGFLHDDLGMLMALMGFIGKYHTFSAHHGCRSAPLSDPFRPIFPEYVLILLLQLGRILEVVSISFCHRTVQCCAFHKVTRRIGLIRPVLQILQKLLCTVSEFSVYNVWNFHIGTLLKMISISRVL